MEILRETANHIAFITLNRPAALNALSLEMLIELQNTLRACAIDSNVHAVLIKGAGEKAFCAGGDIRALYQSFKTSGKLHHEFFVLEYRLDHFLHGYPKPYVALLDGIAMGGGMGIAQGSMLRIVGDRTRMAMPEVGIGLFPDVGASYFLPRLPGAIGNYLALTGNQLRAADALYARLADIHMPRAAIDGIEAVLGDLNWTDDWQADVSRIIRAQGSADLPVPPLAALRPAIDLHFSQTSVPAILHSLHNESRSDYSEWAQQTAQLMATRSPTMLAVTLRQLQRGRQMSLADCFRMELGMVQMCFAQGDFVEGIRALLIDKDNAPHWKPSRIEDVTDAAVDAFFEDPWAGTTHPLSSLEGIHLCS
jgi:enoyl-CoA hydratase/carnithine racemase